MKANAEALWHTTWLTALFTERKQTIQLLPLEGIGELTSCAPQLKHILEMVVILGHFHLNHQTAFL